MKFKDSDLNCKKCNHYLWITEDEDVGFCTECRTYHLIRDNGNVIIPAKIANCPKCGSTYLIPEDNSLFRCDSCGSDYVISASGEHLVEYDIFMQGEAGTLPFVKKKDKLVAFQNKWLGLSKKTKNTIYGGVALVIALILGFYIFSLPSPIKKSMAYANMEKVWKEFRDKNPYNFQSVGLKRYEDNSYVCIISEPNDNITLDELKNFFDDYNYSCTVKSTKMGYDGWLKDAVFCFNDLRESRIPDFTAKINKLLYGTDYKASVLDLNDIPEHVPFSSQDLNYQVSAEELDTWFIKEKETLVGLEDSTSETTLQATLTGSENESDLYMSKEPGFVIWVLDKSATLNAETFRINARKFAIDSDLILGAIANETRVAIIARERSIPVYELPPMRQETMMLLAATQKTELSQSYERTSMFAGKLPGGKDFAPILLSNELWHTEYGSILNITDQMLKSWSENGDIEYHGFKYPKPIDWAFEKGALTDLGVSQLTYNWNTAGAGYVIENDGGVSIYAVNRTGSLPISYIPGETDNITENDPVYQAEERAYDFYSDLNSPELVKVVQYASLYQIFSNFDIHIDNYENAVELYDYYDASDNDIRYPICTPDAIYTYAETVFDSICSFNEGSRNKVIDYQIASYSSIAGLTHAQASLYGLFSGYDMCYELDTLQSAFSQISKYSVLDCLSHTMVFRDASISYNDNDITTLPATEYDSILGIQVAKKELVDLSDFSGAEDKIGYVMAIMNRHSDCIKAYAEVLGVCSRKEAMDAYLSANKDKSSTWIKCPTIVLSWSKTDSATMVGGHNLNADITPVKINKLLKRGEYKVTVDKVTGKKVIEIAAKDEAKITPDFLRRAQRTNLEGKFTNLTETRAVRTRSVVLKEAAHRTSRGFNVADHVVVTKGTSSKFLFDGKAINSVTDLMDEFFIKLNTEGKAPFKTIEFDMISENKVDAIIDNLQHAELTRPAEFKLSGNDYDWGAIVKEKSPKNPNKVIVKIPIKAKSIKMANKTVPIKAGMHKFEIPAKSVDSFIKEFKLFFKNPSRYWEKTKFKFEYHKSMKQRLDEKETIMMKVARLFNINKKTNDARDIQEEEAA